MYSDPSDDLGQSCSHYEAVSSSSSMYEDDFAVIPTTIAYEDMFEGQQQQQQGQAQHCVEDNFMEDALPALPSCSNRNWNDEWQAVVLSTFTRGSSVCLRVYVCVYNLVSFKKVRR